MLFSTSGILVVFWRSPFCVSCVVTATACSWFLRRCLPQDPLECSSLILRGSLSRRVWASCTVFVCSVSLHRDIATNVGPYCLFEFRRSCWCSGRCLWWRWVVHRMLMITRGGLKFVVSSPVLCPAQLSSEALVRDKKRHWLSPVYLSLLDPWSHVVQLHQLVRNLFIRQRQPVVRTRTSHPSTGFHFFSDMLCCELAVALDQFSGTSLQGNLR